MPKLVQIIAFELPVAPYFGGTIVVKSTVDALLQAGVKVVLHAFVKHSADLNKKYPGVTLYTYLRKKSPQRALSPLPYIVTSRQDKKLIENIRKYQGPLLVEGLHGYFVIEQLWKEYPIVLRWHNIESAYYAGLAGLSNGWKRIHFKRESNKLQRLEQNSVLQQIHHVFINEKESDKMDFANSYFIPPFHLNSVVSTYEGAGLFGLYHGKLSIIDNERAALLIATHWPKNSLPLVIAGAAPSATFCKKINEMGHRLIASPDEATMIYLQEAAHVHVLWSFQNEGVKLKTINALYRGRWIVGNENIRIAGFDDTIEIIDKKSLTNTILKCAQKTISKKEIEARSLKMLSLQNDTNVKKMLGVLEQAIRSHNLSE